MADSFNMNAGDGQRLHVYRWLPDAAPRAVVQIAHGMGEHAARYDHAARVLNQAGYAVYANDHRGHGRTADPERLGWLGDDGWNRVVSDAADLTRHIRTEHPGLPVVLFGHSMGAMLSQQYLYRHGSLIDAAVLSGSPGVAGAFQAWLSRNLARFERWRLGADAESPLLQKLLFGKANKPFEGPDSTGFEWLSRDAGQVAAYVNDPYCGFVLRAGSLYELFVGAKEARSMENVLQMPAGLPVYVFSGSDDPVHGEGRNLQRLLDLYRRHLQHVEHRLYPGGRHEMLNETNHDEVIQDLLGWLDSVVEDAGSSSSRAASPN